MCVSKYTVFHQIHYIFMINALFPHNFSVPKSRSPPICSLFGCITQTSCNDFNCKDVLRPFAPVMSIQTQLSWNIAAIWTYPESPVLEIMVLNREKGFEFKTHPMKLNEPLKRLSKLRYYVVEYSFEQFKNWMIKIWYSPSIFCTKICELCVLVRMQYQSTQELLNLTIIGFLNYLTVSHGPLFSLRTCSV